MAKKHKKTRQDMPPKRSSSSRLSGKSLLENLKDGGLIAGGFIGGNQASKFIDKGTTAVAGMMGLGDIGATTKGLLRPALTIFGGCLAHHYAKNKDLKNLALGVIAYGGYDAIKTITGKNLLAGIGDAETVAPQLPPMQYQALPVFQMPVMGTDEPENITAGNDVQTDTQPVAGAEYFSLTEGAGVYDAESITAGLGESEDLKFTA